MPLGNIPVARFLKAIQAKNSSVTVKITTIRRTPRMFKFALGTKLCGQDKIFASTGRNVSYLIVRPFKTMPLGSVHSQGSPAGPKP
jgi:hypothetical protein